MIFGYDFAYLGEKYRNQQIRSKYGPYFLFDNGSYLEEKKKY